MIPALSLRRATASDAATIKQMVRGARLNPFRLDWQRFWLAVDAEGQIIGCIQVKPHGEGVNELASLVTQPGWRGQGVGRRLVEHLQQEAGPPLWLMCESGLTPFYERFGFVEVWQTGEMPAHFRFMRRLSRLFFPPRSGRYLAIMQWPGSVGG